MSSGSGSGSLVARIASAPPHDERAANGEQWRGVLDDDRQRREGTGCDEIERAQALGPGLGARIDDARVLRLGGRNRPLEEGASPGGAFHESNAGLGKRDRQRKARKTGARSEVRHTTGRADRSELEPDQRVRKVVVNRLQRIADRRRRQRILHEQAVQRQ